MQKGQLASYEPLHKMHCEPVMLARRLPRICLCGGAHMLTQVPLQCRAPNARPCTHSLPSKCLQVGTSKLMPFQMLCRLRPPGMLCTGLLPVPEASLRVRPVVAA